MDTVTSPTKPKQTPHIGVVGYIIAAGVALLLLPLLPLLIALKLIDRARTTETPSVSGGYSR